MGLVSLCLLIKTLLVSYSKESTRKNPHVQIKRTQRDVNEERSRRANGIKTYKRKEWWCGINEMDSEDEDSMPYEHAPRCAFQARCRKEEPTTIQHITDKLNDFTYESVCNIPFGKGANYKSKFAQYIS